MTKQHNWHIDSFEIIANYSTRLPLTCTQNLLFPTEFLGFRTVNSCVLNFSWVGIDILNLVVVKTQFCQKCQLCCFVMEGQYTWLPPTPCTRKCTPVVAANYAISYELFTVFIGLLFPELHFSWKNSYFYQTKQLFMKYTHPLLKI